MSDTFGVADRRVFGLGTAVIALCLFAGSSAQAQDGVRSARDEIIVTATKREERLQDVPFSIDAFSEQTINDSGLTDPQDLVLLTPGLQFAETIGRQTGSPAIRGVSPIGFADPTVLIYVDGFTLGFTRNQNNATLFDLERIEVLKGPQSTLYGRNALGGVINYITKKPSDELEGYVRGEYGSFESYNVAGGISGPIITNLLYAKGAIGYRSFGGFLDNEFDGAKNVNDESDLTASGNLRFTPTENLEVNFTFNYADTNDDCGDCAHVPTSFLGTFDPNAYLAIGAGLVDINDFSRTVNQDSLGGFDRQEHTYVLNVEYDFGWATLTNILGGGDVDSSVVVDVTREPGPSFFGSVFDVTIDNSGWSEELRLASDANARFRWLVGLYAFKNTRNSRTVFDDGVFTLADSHLEITNYAGFVNLDYDLTDAFNLGFGMRYDYERNEIEINITGEVRSTDARVWLPKFTASYRPTDDMTIYGTISRGYHAGGTNSSTAPVPVFDPEFVWNYELGIKGSTAEGRLGYEFAAFYLDWQNQQLQQSEDGISVFFNNAGRSRVYGIEASLFAELVDGLTLTAGVAWQNAELVEYTDIINAPLLGVDPDLSGNMLINAPDLSASVSAQYVFSAGVGDWDIRLRADGRYTGEQAADVTNLGIIDAYFIANVYAGLQNDSFELGVFADNVFDEDYLLGGFVPSSFFPPLLSIGDPRIYGVRGRINF